MTRAWSQPEAASASCNVSVTSSAFMVVQASGDDVTREVVEDRAQVEPTPADDPETGEVGLSELIDGGCLVFELICGFDDDERRAGDKVVGLEQAMTRCLPTK